MDMTAESLNAFSWVLIALGIFYSLFLGLSVPKNVFFNGDGTLKALLARQFSQGIFRFDLVEEVEAWIARLWQEGLYPYKAPFVYYLNQRYFVSFPFPFSLLTSFFYQRFQYRGLYIIPLVATWILWVAFYQTPAFWSDWGAPVGLLILIFASPLTLYSATYWEHTLSVSLGFIGIAIAFFPLDLASNHLATTMIGGCLVGFSVWFRSECLALVAALTGLVLLGLTPGQIFIGQELTGKATIDFWGIVAANVQPLAFVAGMLGSILGLWIANKTIYDRFLGVHSLLILDEFSWSKRLREAVTSLQQLNTGFVEYFPLSLIPLSYLLILGIRALDGYLSSQWSELVLAVVILLLVSIAIVVSGIKKAFSFVKNNLLYVLAFVITCYLFSQVEIDLDRQAIFVYCLYLFYVIGVACLVDFAPGEAVVGGKQWGPRYLLPMLPLTTWLSVDLMDSLGSVGSPSVANTGAVLQLLLITLGIYKNLYQGWIFFRKTQQGIAPAIERIAENSSPILVFSHQYAAQVLSFGLGNQKPFFRVEDQQQMIQLCQQLVEKNIWEFPYICYPYRPCKLLDASPEELVFTQKDRSYEVRLASREIIGKYPIYQTIIVPLDEISCHREEVDAEPLSPRSPCPELVCTILPTYNEKENIGPLIRGLLDSMESPYLVLVVDDNSPDGTWKEVEEIAAQYLLSPEDPAFTSGVILRRRIDEKGLTSALQRGIDDAITLYGAKIITWMDCDLSMPPEDVPKLIQALRENQADVSVGSRWIAGGDDVAHGIIARILSWTINRMAIVLLGDRVHDYTSGFVAARSNVLQSIRLQGDYGEYCIDLLARASRLGYKLVEVPYLCVPRIYGESKTGINLWDYLDKGRNYVTTIGKLWRDG
jgi:GT2 family glycosyltransferase